MRSVYVEHLEGERDRLASKNRFLRAVAEAAKKYISGGSSQELRDALKKLEEAERNGV